MIRLAFVQALLDIVFQSIQKCRFGFFIVINDCITRSPHVAVAAKKLLVKEYQGFFILHFRSLA
jgi:hypothetical protein